MAFCRDRAPAVLPPATPRVFACKPFMRFAQRIGIGDAELQQAVDDNVRVLRKRPRL